MSPLLSGDLSHMLGNSSPQQLKSLLLSTAVADKTFVERGGLFEEISSVFLYLFVI